jgi:hypothetical protein
MNKQGFIQILQKGRKNQIARNRFWRDWIDKSERNISEREKVSCCYAYFYDEKRNTVASMVEHCITDEHILKLVARHGFESEYLLREIRYYTNKILEGKI